MRAEMISLKKVANLIKCMFCATVLIQAVMNAVEFFNVCLKWECETKDKKRWLDVAYRRG